MMRYIEVAVFIDLKRREPEVAQSPPKRNSEKERGEREERGERVRRVAQE